MPFLSHEVWTCNPRSRCSTNLRIFSPSLLVFSQTRSCESWLDLDPLWLFFVHVTNDSIGIASLCTCGMGNVIQLLYLLYNLWINSQWILPSAVDQRGYVTFIMSSCVVVKYSRAVPGSGCKLDCVDTHTHTIAPHYFEGRLWLMVDVV